jgi:hypothetical protein
MNIWKFHGYSHNESEYQISIQISDSIHTNFVICQTHTSRSEPMWGSSSMNICTKDFSSDKERKKERAKEK